MEELPDEERDNLTNLLLFKNLSLMLNFSVDRIDFRVFDRYEKNLRITPPKLYYLIAAYACLILIGSLGNALVVTAVVRKPQMRTVRNVFVVNLAVADLLLCLVTMPLTLMEIVTVYWPLGNNAIGCKITGTLQGTSVFVSTLSITAIAIDRHRVIIHPTKRSLPMVGAIISLICIWIIATLVSLPNFIWRKLETHKVQLPQVTYNISFCFEDWTNPRGRFIYSIVVMILQYVIPIFTMSLAYCMICFRVQKRMNVKRPKEDNAKNRRFDSVRKFCRMSNTTKLLLSITLIYCFSWFPLNTFNVCVDLNNPFGDNTDLMLIIYALCHMVGMSSACSNPLLYGWLNKNFKKEFYEIFDAICPFCTLTKRESDVQQQEVERRTSQVDVPKFKLKPLKRRKKNLKKLTKEKTEIEVLEKVEEEPCFSHASLEPCESEKEESEPISNRGNVTTCL